LGGLHVNTLSEKRLELIGKGGGGEGDNIGKPSLYAISKTIEKVLWGGGFPGREKWVTDEESGR